MTVSPSSAVIDLQLRHASVRAFTDKAIEPDLLRTLIQAGQAAATSSFIQAYSVIQVTLPESRRAIAAAAGGQAWIEKAAEFLVFCADLRRVDDACQRAGRGALEGWADHSVQAMVDVSLMGQNVLLAAESVGLGGVFIGGIRNDPAKVADLLAIPEWVTPLFGMCLGWPALHNHVKPRMPVDLVLHRDHYADPDPAAMNRYDAHMSAYYQSRSSNAKLSDWSTATANAIQGKTREHMLPFLQARGFFKR